MTKAIFRNRFWLVAVLIGLMLALPYSDALAWGGHDGGHDSHGGRGGHDNYHYRGGRWYRSGWLGFDIAVGALAVGAIIASLPNGYRTVVVSGSPYYYYDGYYFSNSPYGYVVVPQPVAVAQPVIVQPAPVVMAAPQMLAGGDSTVINVPNSRGGYTPVMLTRRGRGYVGPQGEYYDGSPTIDQLKVLYGK